MDIYIHSSIFHTHFTGKLQQLHRKVLTGIEVNLNWTNALEKQVPFPPFLGEIFRFERQESVNICYIRFPWKICAVRWMLLFNADGRRPWVSPESGQMETSTLLETSIFTPENRPSQGNSFSNHPFSGARLVSGRVTLDMADLCVSRKARMRYFHTSLTFLNAS